MRRKDFEKLVSAALDDLPEEFARRMENIAIVVEEEAGPEEKASTGLSPYDTLLGLYQGIPLTERTSWYNMVAPDRIVIYQRPFDELFQTDEEKVREVRRTVIHEIAHHFGISDKRLRELGY
jgi:predicted Zn-dependent protease with MMP-like domain